MSIQQSEDSGLSVATSPWPQVWSTGTEQDGVDERIELARLAGNDVEARIAVRDARHPSAPALLFGLPAWHALLGQQPESVDLR